MAPIAEAIFLHRIAEQVDTQARLWSRVSRSFSRFVRVFVYRSPF